MEETITTKEFQQTDLEEALKDDKERIHKWLNDALIKCGWRDILKQECVAYVRGHSLKDLTLDAVIQHAAGTEAARIPPHIETDLSEFVEALADGANMSQG
eukprot:GHVO01056510.1.p1 GENE.GHVO01056510.1~~GHVO01056510.1.p1  ORF type:complete len:101 (-),score=29.81 GHVO01056510.1:314-616(-)